MIWIYNIAKRKGRHAIGWLTLASSSLFITLIGVASSPLQAHDGRQRSSSFFNWLLRQRAPSMPWGDGGGPYRSRTAQTLLRADNALNVGW